MDNRTGMAILLAIVAAGMYRIVVLRRLLDRLDARALAARALAGQPVRPVPTLARVRPSGAVPAQLRRHPAVRSAWEVRGSDGVALDPTIGAPDPT
jgi:hypothetical protein